MVSIKTIAIIGALIAGASLFLGAGGASGVGTKIGAFFGGGFKDFSSSISSAFTSGLTGGIINPSTAAATDNGIIGPDPRTGTEAFDPIGNLVGNFTGLQNILDSLNNFFTGGAKQTASGFSAPAFNDQQSIRDFNLIQLQQASLGRPINVSRSVAATRESGGEVFTVITNGRERTFATAATAASFAERISR